MSVTLDRLFDLEFLMGVCNRVACVAVGVVVVAGASASAQNLLLNAGFEEGSLNHWGSYANGDPQNAVALSGPGAYDGAWYARGFNVPAGNVESLVQSFDPVDSGSIAEMSFWYRFDTTGAEASTANLYMYMHFVGSPLGAYTQVEFIADGAWHQFIQGSPGVNASINQLGFLVTNTGSVPSAGMSVDRFYLGTTPQTPAPGAAVVLGLGAMVAGRRRR